MRLYLRRALVIALSASVLYACASPDDVGNLDSEAQEARAADLQISLSLGQSAYAAHEAVQATVTITNAGKSTVKLLSWFLPAADLEEPLFSVAHEGGRAEFQGPHYKRPPAVEGDFVKLAAGASLTRTVNIGHWYDLSKTGDYQVRFVVDAGDLRPHDRAKGTILSSNTTGAWIEGRKSAPLGDQVVDGVVGLIAYTNCDVSQQGQVLAAANAASDYAYVAKTYLNSAAHETPRYTTWFGTFSSGDWDTIRSHFTAIADAFTTKPLTVDCKCKKPYYAYVYSNQPYKIYVCKVFWQAPLTGTDSRAGTLIHEMSHFNVVAGTNDWAYGQNACKSLAVSDPSRARDNADSHEYFAENNPEQQ